MDGSAANAQGAIALRVWKLFSVLPVTLFHFLYKLPERRPTVRPHPQWASRKAYRGLDPEYVHEIVDHAEEYVEGKIHVNGLENF